MDKVLVIASRNVGKIKEFRHFLSAFPLEVISQPDDISVEETGKSFSENARLKAVSVANATGEWSLADDSGLSVDALGGAPGIYSARYANNDQERINRLLRELQGIDNRSACFSAAICIASPGNEILLEVEGRCDGVITDAPRGENGFGYDPIFEVIQSGLTFGEMLKHQKKFFSHRGAAFSLLEPGLKKLLKM